MKQSSIVRNVIWKNKRGRLTIKRKQNSICNGYVNNSNNGDNSNNGNNSNNENNGNNGNSWDNQTNNNLEVKLNGKYYTESEIEDIVKKRISDNRSGRGGNNTNNCTPRPYEASDLQNPLFNSELTGAKI